MERIRLFTDESECCGCGACANACPSDAISMKPNLYGYVYPSIDGSKCVSCGACMQVCPIKKSGDLHANLETYAAALKNDDYLKKSSSGGIFSALAVSILRQGGVVYGAAYDDKLVVRHIAVDKPEDLHLLQGSKYVQSDTDYVFRNVKETLAKNKKVLFSGTPCQTAGLKNYLKREYDNLLTVDVLCHGVPSYQMFRESLNFLDIGKRSIVDIAFRDKRRGWGTGGTVYTKVNHRNFEPLTSSYYYYYLRDSLNRDSCYHCKFACLDRVGDITLGDYWRIESAHPQEVSKFCLRNGVSCVMLNTRKGLEAFDSIRRELITVPSKVELVKERNGRLRECDSEPELRGRLLRIYEADGWAGIQAYWKKNERNSRIALRIKRMIPGRLKSWIKRTFSKR